MNQNINEVVENVQNLELGTTSINSIEDVLITISKSTLYDMVFDLTFRFEGHQRHIPYANLNNNQLVNTIYENIRLIKIPTVNEITIQPSNQYDAITKHIPIRMAFSDKHLIKIFDDLLEIAQSDVANDFIHQKPATFFELPQPIQDKYIEEVAIARAIDVFNSNIYDFVEKYPKLIESNEIKEELSDFIKTLDNKEIVIQIVERKE